MKTCPKCGCYIPDNWITCPACHNTEKKESKVFPNGFYQVKVYCKDNTVEDNIFGIYENALKYAVRMSERRYDVKFVEVWDCQTHARLHLLHSFS